MVGLDAHRTDYVKGAARSDGMLTWVPDCTDLVPITFIELDYLLKEGVDKLPKDMGDTPLEEFLNPQTWYETEGLGEPSMRSLSKGDVIQIMKRGFFKIDQIGLNQSMRLIYLPDGSTKSMSILGELTDKVKKSNR